MDKNSKDLIKENIILSKENAALRQKLQIEKKSADIYKTENINNLDVNKTMDKTSSILIEKMHDGAITLDSNGSVLYCNSSFAKLICNPVKNIIGRKFVVYVNDSSQEYFEALFKQGLENYIKEDVYINLNNGKVLPVLMSLNTLWVNNEFVLSIIVTDLTARNKNKADIALLAAIVESSDDAIISKSIDGVIKTWSKGSEKMFGYTAKEVIGKPISLIIPPMFIKEEEEIDKRIRNNEIFTYNAVRIKKNKEIFYVTITVSPLKDVQGNIIGAFKIDHDVTHQKKLEEELIRTNKELLNQNKEKEKVSKVLIDTNKELKESKQWFYKIFDYNPIPMIMTNFETGKFQNVNEKFLTVFGYSKEEVIGKTGVELKMYSPESRKKYIEMLREQSILDSFEGVVRKKNGDKFWTFTSAQLINLNGVKFVLASFQDITTRKNAEDELKSKSIQLEHKNNELEKMNKELAVQIAEKEKGVSELFVYANNVKELEELVTHKESILAVLSHDLRSPLTGIIGLADYLKNEFADMERSEVQHVINLLDESAKKELTMLDNLVEWARIKYASEAFTPTKLKLFEYVQQAIDALHETAALKEIILYNEIEEYIVVFADGNMLLSILQNIVSNAVKYSNNGGTITIRSKIKDHKIIVDVKDHGTGMSKKVMEQIFSPQIKHLSEARRENKGAGIGLLLAKEFLAKNHGEIWVESLEGEGSSFYFTLPVDETYI